jgi:hypothetical protein
MIFYNSPNLVDETPCPSCGWPKSSCLCDDWQARAEAAEAEVERLRQELATVAADVKLMLRTPHNHDWLASGDCPRCAIEQRLIANTTPARQRSSGGAVDDD